MATGPLNEQQVRDYRANGYALAKGLFDAEETGLLSRAAKEDRQLDQHSFGRKDGEGGTVRLSGWNHRATRSTACSHAVSPSWIRWKSYWRARFTITTRK